MSPVRPRTHALSDQSVAKLCGLFASVGWVAEELDRDYGEDLLVRIFADGESLAETFYVQLKSSENVSKLKTADSRWVRVKNIKPGHFRHWDKFLDPVFIILWDFNAEIFYWEMVQEPEKVPSIGGKSSTFYLPADNQLDAAGIKRIAVRTRLRHRRLAKEKIGAEILSEHFERLFDVKISYDSQLGILVVCTPGYQPRVEFWGETATIIQNVANKEGVTTQEAFELLVSNGDKLVQGFTLGASIVFEYPDKSWAEKWDSLKEFERHFARKRELG